MLDVVDRVCRHAYVLGLLLAALTFSLAPLHVLATQKGNVTRVLPDNRIEVSVGDLGRAEVGDEAQVYRFNPGWMREIGKATVVERRGEQLVLQYDPSTYAWPMGVQGTVTDVEGTVLELNVGTEIGLQAGQNLNLFDERRRVGVVRVTSAGTGSSDAVILKSDLEPVQAMGLQVTPFTIPNQVTHLGARWVIPLEWLAIGLTAALWFWTLVSPVPGQLLERGAQRIRAVVVREYPAGVRYALWVLMGVPVCVVGIQIAGWFWIDAPQMLWNDIRAIEQFVPIIPSSNLRPSLGLPDLRGVPVLVTGVVFLWWVWTVLTQRRNPLNVMLEEFRFRREEAVVYRLFAAVPKGLLNWILHWAVFYLFARNLRQFLMANMKAAANVGWAEHQLPFADWGDWLSSTLFMLTHAPTLAGVHEFFEMARYLTWSACIIGCLIGYGHTIVSILWKRDAIKWVDFTVVGWMVNLICYGAWATAVFKVFPHPAGVDPSVTDGPMVYLMPTTELYLNVVYTLSIFNMGTRFGVMVDKGVVDRGFYSVVRHPSYTLEPLMFSVLYLNRITDPWLAVGLLAHPFMYWWRSERDDHFMGHANPDYPKYRERVSYKYVPGVW